MAPLIYPRTITGAFVASPDFNIYTVSASGNFNITIPSPPANGISYTFCRTDSNSAFSVNLIPTTGTIGGLTSFSLPVGVSLTIVSFQGDWFVEGNNITNSGVGAQLLIPNPSRSTIRGITSADNTIAINQGASAIDISIDNGNFVGSLTTTNLSTLDTWLNVTYTINQTNGDYSGATTGITGITGPVMVASSTKGRNTIVIRTALVVPAAGFTAGAPSSIGIRVLTQNFPTGSNPNSWVVRGTAQLTGIPNSSSAAPWMARGTSFLIPINLFTQMEGAVRNLLVQVKASGGSGIASLNFDGALTVAPDPFLPTALANVLFINHY